MLPLMNTTTYRISGVLKVKLTYFKNRLSTVKVKSSLTDVEQLKQVKDVRI